jgi:hypothetical protein
MLGCVARQVDTREFLHRFQYAIDCGILVVQRTRGNFHIPSSILILSTSSFANGIYYFTLAGGTGLADHQQSSRGIVTVPDNVGHIADIHSWNIWPRNGFALLIDACYLDWKKGKRAGWAPAAPPYVGQLCIKRYLDKY